MRYLSVSHLLPDATEAFPYNRPTVRSGLFFGVILNMKVVVVLVEFVAIVGAGISYDHQDQWKATNGSFCGGNKQSPINIVSAKSDSGCAQLILNGWSKNYRGTFDNNGHSIQFNPKKKKATLTTDRGTYTVQQFHFHWGRNDSEGSEHQVEGKKFSSELHFVTKKDGEEDNTVSDYYSVLAVLFEADPTISKSQKPWKKVDVERLFENGASAKTKAKFGDFLPDNLDYYHYEGSLTTPNCNEIVQWYILQTPVKMPTDFLLQLRQLHDDHDHAMTFDFRDPQPLNGRIITSCP